MGPKIPREESWWPGFVTWLSELLLQSLGNLRGYIYWSWGPTKMSWLQTSQCTGKRPGSKHYECNMNARCSFKSFAVALLRSEPFCQTMLYCAGFPCQPYSLLGALKRLDDENAKQLYRIIDQLGTTEPADTQLQNNVRYFWLLEDCNSESE